MKRRRLGNRLAFLGLPVELCQFELSGTSGNWHAGTGRARTGEAPGPPRTAPQSPPRRAETRSLESIYLYTVRFILKDCAGLGAALDRLPAQTTRLTKILERTESESCCCCCCCWPRRPVEMRAPTLHQVTGKTEAMLEDRSYLDRHVLHRVLHPLRLRPRLAVFRRAPPRAAAVVVAAAATVAPTAALAAQRVCHAI